MSLVKEFKEFAVKGNVVDMAVGVIIGAAFGKIVSSLVADVVMPPLGLLIGGIDFTHFEFVLREGIDKAPPVSIKYGVFLQTTFDFLIVAIAVFLMIKMINRLKRQQAEPPPAPAEPPKQEQLLAEIRDLLKAKP
ncbi:MAG TPA: large-conductance mechanosensitive channel protein MscL [Polyangiaceae bacterium]|jgi:large conductance mechanosensitive channel|nr:large-conductance mechanosensitive channel protein MscL [Polyangiaceae bacterium]